MDRLAWQLVVSFQLREYRGISVGQTLDETWALAQIESYFLPPGAEIMVWHPNYDGSGYPFQDYVDVV
jgi:hypothetical protein